MKLNKESLIHNLWDIHQIIRGKELRKQFLRRSEEEKNEIIHYYYLNRCLQWRKNQDPGFFSYVITRVSTNPEIIEKTLEYVKKIFAETTSTFDDYFAHDKIIERASKEKTQIQNQARNSYRVWENQSPENLQKILYKNYLVAIERGDEDEAIAIRDQTVKSRSPLILWGGDLFLEENNLDLVRSFAPVGGCKWDSEGRFFLASKINNFDLYLSSETNEFDSDFLQLIDYPIVKTFREKFEISPADSSQRGFSIEPPRSIKFGRDCFRIASEFLFDSLSETEKISLLNSEYTYSLNLSANEISQHFGDCGSILRTFSAMKGMSSEAIQIYNLAFSKSKSNKEKGEICKSIADCYKTQEKFSDAYGLYEHSFYFTKDHLNELLKAEELPVDRHRKQLRDIQVDSLKSELIRRLIEMAEMKFLLGDQFAAENSIDKTIQILGSLALDHLKTGNILAIAEGYHDCGLDKKAIKILESCIQILPERLGKHVESELTQLKNLTGIYETSFEEEEKRNSDEYNFSRLFRWAEAERAAFQYSPARSFLNSYLDKISSSSANPLATLSVGKECFNIGFYQEAVRILEPIISNSSVEDCRRQALLYSGISRVLSGETEDGLSELHNMIDLTATEMSRANRDRYIQLQELSIQWLFIRILERGLVLGENNIVAIVDDLKDHSLKKLEMKPEELIDMIACAYQTVGWDDKALREEQEALNRIEYDSENYKHFAYFIGLQYDKKGDLEKSLIWLERAMNHPSGKNNSQFLASIMSKMAETNFQLCRFNEARDLIQKSYVLDSRTTEINFPHGKKRLDEYLSNQISFESIQHSDVKSIFKTAEHLFRSHYADIVMDKNKKEFDLSIILFNYGKGLETLLDAEVWVDLREQIFTKFSEDGTCVDDDESFSKLPKCFKMALSKYPERETISLGTWARMDPNCDEEHKVVNEVNRYLKTRFGKNFEIIRKGCEVIAPYRNLGGHREVIKSSEEMIARRKIIVPLINSVIHEVSKQKG